MEKYAGEIYAILSGLFWAMAVCLFKKGGSQMPPITLNLFKNIIGVFLFAISLPIVGQPLFIDVPAYDYLMLILSGFIGMTLGDTVFFAALKRVGASLWAIVTAFYAPSVILMAYIVLDERLPALGFIGIAMIVFAIVLASTKKSDRIEFDKNRLIGVGLGILSLLLMAAGIVMMKPILDRSPLWWAIQIRLIGATFSLFVIVLLSPKRRELLRAMLPDKHWKYIVPGSIIGPYFALGFWIAGFKYTLAGIAAILNQLNMVFIFVFAWLFLKEPLTWRRWVGLIVALSGAAVVIYFKSQADALAPVP
ncbi:MAG: DMT family transporter [Candidatus Coatesbacteria bacterium]|nr:DMT family transporter [Candidatus Coatesbacteria bacterium]